MRLQKTGTTIPEARNGWFNRGFGHDQASHYFLDDQPICNTRGTWTHQHPVNPAVVGYNACKTCAKKKGQATAR